MSSVEYCEATESVPLISNKGYKLLFKNKIYKFTEPIKTITMIPVLAPIGVNPSQIHYNLSEDRLHCKMNEFGCYVFTFDGDHPNITFEVE